MNTAKAINLARLSRITKVPPFLVVSRAHQDFEPSPVLSDSLIVRGCLADEDGSVSARAGEGLSIGPVPQHEVQAVVSRIFQQSAAVECIIQSHIEGASGVLFTSSENCAFLEYSNLPQGVTSGKCHPFAAVFPNELAKYTSIGSQLAALWREFGAADYELINLKDPFFVQTRPITVMPDYDLDLLQVKMHLQELEADAWQQTEFCVDLAETPDIENTLIGSFCSSINTILSEIGVTGSGISQHDFIKLGDQIYFARAAEINKLKSARNWIRLGMMMQQELMRIPVLLATEEPPITRLMRAAIAVRFIAEILSHFPSLLRRPLQRRIFGLREEIRAALIKNAAKSSLPAYQPFARRLDSSLIKDSAKCCWNQFSLADSLGQVIVAGSFHEGPWKEYQRGDPAPAEKSFLTTRELYPELLALFPHIKGIIAHGGACTSHITIHAREKNMPLWIQVPADRLRASIEEWRGTTDPYNKAF